MATISENLQTIIDIKADIKTAIENKGITVGDASFGSYAEKINEITVGVAECPECPECPDPVLRTKTINIGSNGISSYHAADEGCDGYRSITVRAQVSSTSTPVFTIPDGMKFAHSTVSDFSNIPFPSSPNGITTCRYMFAYCEEMTDCPQFDANEVFNIDNMFYGCQKLQRIPLLDFSYVYYSSEPFGECYSLTDVEGFTDLGMNFFKNYIPSNYNDYDTDTRLSVINFYQSPLTRRSCVNIFNELFDISSFIDEPFCHEICINDEYSYSSLSYEDIAIATSKGWHIRSRVYDIPIINDDEEADDGGEL